MGQNELKMCFYEIFKGLHEIFVIFVSLVLE